MSTEGAEGLVAKFVDTDAVQIETEAGLLHLVRTNMDGNWHGVALEVGGQRYPVPQCYTPSAEVLAAIAQAEYPEGYRIEPRGGDWQVIEGPRLLHSAASPEAAHGWLRAHVTAEAAFERSAGPRALAAYVSAKLPQGWRLYSCTDCDPELANEGDEGEPYEAAYHVLLPLDALTQNPDGGPLDTCPRCGSLYSLVADRTVYAITLGVQG